MFKNRYPKVFAFIAAVMVVLLALGHITKSSTQNYDNSIEEDFSFYPSYEKWTYLSQLSPGSGNGKINGAVYKFTEDNPVPVKFSEEVATCMKVTGDWIYYVVERERKDTRPSGSIFKMKTDGTEKSKLVDEASLLGFSLYGGYIYYRKSSGSHELLRVKLDGSSSKTISTDMLSFYIQGDRIYYISSTHPGDLYRMKLDGSSRKKVTNIGGPIVYINDSYIYFIETASETKNSNNLSQTQKYYVGNEGSLFRIRKNGMGKELVINEKLSHIFVRNDYIYYHPSIPIMDSKIYRTDLNGKNKIEIPLKGSYLGIGDKWIYYLDPKNRELYRTTLDLKQEQKIETDLFKRN